jgi:uncharacterized protein (TIGR02996 family)
MTQERDLLRAISRDPEDCVVRLVYADWLSDHGHEDRAELVRAQVRLAATRHVRTPQDEERIWAHDWSDPADTPERRALASRCRELLDAHEAAWLAPLGGLLRGEHYWSRGFVEGLQTDAAALVRYGGELFDACPIQRLIFAAQEGAVEALASLPAENALAALDLILCDVDLAALRRLASLPGLRSLTEVNLLFNRLDDFCIDLLCDEPFFVRLSRLILGSNPFTQDGRQRLVERYGDRVCFVHRRHPERLFTLKDNPSEPSGLRDDSELRAGHGPDRTQLYLEENQSHLLLVTFDQLGDLLRIETRHRSERQLRRLGEAREAWRKELGMQPGAIRVKLFERLAHFPKGLDAFERADREPAEREAQAAAVRRWLEKPAYRLGGFCGGWHYHLDSGERR